MDSTEQRIIVSVVDDDESVRKTLARIIRSQGLIVEAYGSAEEFLNNEGPDNSACLILDVNLPGISGIELQERLSKADRRIPIIFISANTDERTRDSAMKAGARDFLGKPFQMTSLLAAIRSTI